MTNKTKLIMKLVKVCGEYDESLNPHPGDETFHYYDDIASQAIHYVSNKRIKEWIKETKKKIK